MNNDDDIYNILAEMRDLLKQLVRNTSRPEIEFEVIADIMTGNDEPTVTTPNTDALAQAVKDHAHQLMNDGVLTRKEIKAEINKIAGDNRSLMDMTEDQLLKLDAFMCLKAEDAKTKK